jgi:hypothetical protein
MTRISFAYGRTASRMSAIAPSSFFVGTTTVTPQSEGRGLQDWRALMGWLGDRRVAPG